MCHDIMTCTSRYLPSIRASSRCIRCSSGSTTRSAEPIFERSCASSEERRQVRVDYRFVGGCQRQDCRKDNENALPVCVTVPDLLASTGGRQVDMAIV